MVRLHGVVIGDHDIGKTSLVYGLVGKRIPQEHIPTLLEIYCIELEKMDNAIVELVLTDTPGHEDYYKITEMALENKDLVLLCYSATEMSSYENISKKVSQIQSNTHYKELADNMSVTMLQRACCKQDNMYSKTIGIRTCICVVIHVHVHMSHTYMYMYM